MSVEAKGWPSELPLTVVIPALNATPTLAAQLEALDRQTIARPFEVIVVDNDSTDGTADLARSFESARFRVRVVSEPRRGVNLARNAGVEAAADGLVALCDADDVVEPGWLEAFCEAFADGHWLAGEVDYTLMNTPRTREMWGVGERTDHSGEPEFGDNGLGGNCAFTRQMWLDVGRFDDALSGHGDESEFFLRAWAAGFRVRWVQAAVINVRLRTGLKVMTRHRYRKGKSVAFMETRSGGRLLAPEDRRSQLKTWAYIVLMAPVAVVSPKVRFPWVRLTFFRLGRLIGRATLRREGR